MTEGNRPSVSRVQGLRNPSTAAPRGCCKQNKKKNRAMTSPSTSASSRIQALYIRWLEDVLDEKNPSLDRKNQELSKAGVSNKQFYDKALASMAALEVENQRLKAGNINRPEALDSEIAVEYRRLREENAMLRARVSSLQGNAARLVDLVAARTSRSEARAERGLALVDQGEAAIAQGVAMVHEGSQMIRTAFDDYGTPGKEEEDLLDELQSGSNLELANPTPSGEAFCFPIPSIVVQGSGNSRSTQNSQPRFEELEWAAGTDYENPQSQWSVHAQSAAQALPKSVPRSSAEIELLRLKDRKTLNRLGHS